MRISLRWNNLSDKLVSEVEHNPKIRYDRGLPRLTTSTLACTVVVGWLDVDS